MKEKLILNIHERYSIGITLFRLIILLPIFLIFIAGCYNLLDGIINKEYKGFLIVIILVLMLGGMLILYFKQLFKKISLYGNYFILNLDEFYSEEFQIKKIKFGDVNGYYLLKNKLILYIKFTTNFSGYIEIKFWNIFSNYSKIKKNFEKKEISQLDYSEYLNLSNHENEINYKETYYLIPKILVLSLKKYPYLFKIDKIKSLLESPIERIEFYNNFLYYQKLKGKIKYYNFVDYENIINFSLDKDNFISIKYSENNEEKEILLFQIDANSFNLLLEFASNNNIRITKED